MTKKELLDYLNIKIATIKKIGNSTIINNRYVYKPMKRESDFYDYLLTRNFNYFPTIYSNVGDEIELMDYIEETEIPLEQKLEDISYLVSILHLNTMFDKLIDLDQLKEIYETTNQELDNLYNYFYDKQNQIEEEVYMSPANYLLIRNMTLIYKSIALAKEFLTRWYKIVKDNNNIRYTYIHSNLRDTHLLTSDKLYLISWDKSTISFPIKDIEIFYKNSYLDISLSSILKTYEVKFPLKKEEKFLLFTNLLIPRELESYDIEYLKTKDISSLITYLEMTYNYLKNYSKESDDNRSKQE